MTPPQLVVLPDDTLTTRQAHTGVGLPAKGEVNNGVNVRCRQTPEVAPLPA